jgi:hypothetical protein
MLLITFNKWVGSSRNCPPDHKISATKELVAYASELPLDAALGRLVSYQNAWNEKSSFCAIEHELVYVNEISGVGYGMLELVNVLQIEGLPSNPNEIDI